MFDERRKVSLFGEGLVLVINELPGREIGQDETKRKGDRKALCNVIYKLNGGMVLG